MSVNGPPSLKKPTLTHVTSNTRTFVLLLIGSLLLTSCVTMPWNIRASVHFDQTYRTRMFPNSTDVFIRPSLNLYASLDLESVWVEIRKEVNSSELQFNVKTVLSNGNGLPFQFAQISEQTLDFSHTDLSTYDAMEYDFTSVEMTVQRFTIRIPVNITSVAACDSKDLTIQLSGANKDSYDLTIPKEMLQGFLGKVKKSGEDGIEGPCFDQFL